MALGPTSLCPSFIYTTATTTTDLGLGKSLAVVAFVSFEGSKEVRLGKNELSHLAPLFRVRAVAQRSTLVETE